MFRSSDAAYLKHSNINKISLILDIGYDLRFNYLFIFLKSLRKRTQSVLSLGCEKYGAPHYESFSLSRNPSWTKILTTFLEFLHLPLIMDMVSNILASNPILIYVFRVTSVSSNNSLKFCNNFRNLLHYFLSNANIW